MKYLLTTYILFSFCNLFSQGLNGELGFNENYYQLSKGLITVGEHSIFVKLRNLENSFFTKCSLVKIDTNENILWELAIQPQWAEKIEVTELIPSETNGAYLLGYGWPTCDVAMDCFWFVQKYDSNGFLNWTKTWQNSGCGEADFGGLSMDQNNLLNLNSWKWNENTSKIYSLGLDGELIDSLVVPVKNFSQMNSTSYFTKIGSINDSIFAFDSTGGLELTLGFSGTLKGLTVVNDTVFALTEDSLFLFDAFLNPILSGDIAGFENYSNLKVTATNIQLISNNTGSQEIITLDHLLQVENILSLPIAFDSQELIDYNDIHFSSSQNFSLTENTAIRHLDFSMISAEDTEVNRTDIGIVDFQVYQMANNPTWIPEVFVINIYGSALIKNFGTKTLDLCKVNHYVEPGFCSSVFYIEEFSSLDLLPGDSIWVDLGLVHSGTMFSTEDTIKFEMCLFTSYPNTKTDLIVSNDQYCEELIMGYAGLETLEKLEKTLIKITDLLGREVKDQTNTLLIYTYSDGTVEKVFKGN